MGFILAGLDSESYDRSYSDRELMARIAGYFRAEWRRMTVVAVTITLNTAFNTARPLLITQGINLLTAGSSTQATGASTEASGASTRALILLSAAIVLSGGLAWLFNYVQQRASARATGNVVLRLAEDSFRAVTERDMSFYDENASGRIVSRVTSDTQDFGNVVNLVMNLASQILQVIVLLIVLAVIDWRLTLIVLATSPAVIGLSLGLRKIARKVTLEAKRARAAVNANVQESISGISVAKSFRQEQALYETFLEVNQKTYRIGLIRGLTLENIFPALDALAAIGTALIVYTGGMGILNTRIDAGTWYLFIQGLQRFWFPLTSIASFWSQFQDGLSAAERVFSLIDAEPKVVQVASLQPGRLQGSIEFDLLHRGRHHLLMEGWGDLVRAELNDPEESLPRIPPFRVGGRLRYNGGTIRADIGLTQVGNQTHVAPMEEESEGYSMLEMSLGYRLFTGGVTHDFLIRGSNLTNTEARNHTSFLKELAPLPGRDVRFMYRVYF